MTNNVKYRQIKAFSLAVELGSFRAAADALFVTQPSFTALIKALEADVGALLFERTTRKCSPTQAGLAFYQEVSRALEDMEEAYRHAKQEGAGVRGRLTIATVPSLSFGFLTDVLGAYHRLYPDIRIFISEHRSDEVLAAVRQNRVELGIGRLLGFDADLTFTPLFSDRLLIAAPADHAILKQEKISWLSLNGHRLILIGGGTTEQEVKMAMPGLLPAIEVTHLVTAMSMVRKRMGIAVIPNSAMSGLYTEGMAFKPIEESTAVRQLGIIQRSKRPMTATARNFASLLEAQAPAAMEQWAGAGR